MKANDLEQLIRERRTIHRFEHGAMEVDFLKKALELALLAPNHRLTCPSRFWILGHEARHRWWELEQNSSRHSSPEALEKIKKILFQTPTLIVLAQKKCEDPFQAKEDYATLAMGLQNLSLWLWAQGFGSKWSTSALSRSEALLEVLSLKDQEVEFAGLFMVGKAQVVPPPVQRKSGDEQIFFLP